MSRDEDDWSDGLNSFDNIAWSPILDDGDDELPDDATRVSSRWLRYSSFHRYSGQDGASLLELGADNSQGYQHFYTDYRFHRRGRLAGTWLRLITLLRQIPRHIVEVSSRSGHSQSLCEVPRAVDRSDLINVSELFPPTTAVYPELESVTTRAYRAPTKPSSSTMGSLYRSEPMKLCEMILVKDAAYDCVGELGKYGNVQFNDTALDELERDFVELNRNDSHLRKNLNEMREFQYVLRRVDQFFEVHMEDEAMNKIEAPEHQQDTFSKSITSGGHISGQNDIPLTPLLNDEKGENAWFVAGVIPLDKKNTFERVLWRACRRTAFVRISDITLTLEDPVTLAPIVKCVFIVFFKGESLKMIIDKVCDGFNARQYPCPKTSKERQSALFETISRIQDLKIVIDSTQKHRFQILEDVAKDLPTWLKKVHLQKAIYHTLNMFTVDTNGFLAAECWIPENEMDTVHNALQKASGCDVSPILNEMAKQTSPPTFHRTNKFTSVFQSIVDSYGVASYREINPGLFFILNEQKILARRIRGEIFNTFFGGRYIIVLMGLFSIYTGVLYNDAFAKSFNVFGSSWANPYNQSEIESWIQPKVDAREAKITTVMLDPATAYLKERGPYPFGVDPIWNIAENRLSFLNSMKMKMSVIIGVLQMTFGVFLSLLNHIFFNSKVDILTNFIPQLVFLSCIFIYLCGQMVVKWLFFSVEKGIVLGMEYPGSYCAPSLLIGLINMFMLKERPVGYMMENNGTVHHPTCYLNQWYPDQALVEKCLLLTAVGCIPIMLIGRPLAAYFEQKKMAGRRKFLNGILGDDSEHLIAIDRYLHEHSLTDAFVHQAIHTIEFVLGCVSHTASYLRLIFSYILEQQVFFFFAIMSLSILVMMEGLSAFLHALRLHWVEFQSKFYQGAGHAFRPYSLQECLETAQHLSEVTEEQSQVSEVTDEVELENTMQVHDLLAFLVRAQPAIASAPSPIPVPPPCPPISQLPSSSLRICGNSPPPTLLPELKATTSAQFPTTSTPRQMELKPASHQMADDDTDENDLSIDNPSEMHNYTVMEEDGEVSGQARDVPEQDPLGIQHLHNELNTLKKMNVLKTKIQCAVCDEKCEIRSQAEEFVSHVNRRHARIHILSVEQTRRLKELTEACFGVRWR
ncbi:V-type ATPase subunit family protein [Ancylostoma ceylanicum]|uniref:V-type ATPase subunit family protein n=1 Tax=Ancylostoma ceylanicum TaxID=53326 RepID=A0A0D6M0G9_9BILA|nr:V-type ATPase subunit family protein [Ancylostoma ceylanicum]